MAETDVVLPEPDITPPMPSTVFRGPNGIRAGWRALIFLAIFAVMVLVVNLAVAAVFYLRGQPLRPQFSLSLTPVSVLQTDGILLLFAALAALVMARIERRKWGQYGLPLASAFGKDFWIGLLIGFSSISAALFAIFLLHGFHLAGLAVHGRTLLLATAEWTGAFVIVGLGEEFAFRGYLQYTLTTGMGYWPSAILLSSLFGLAHAFNPGESKVGVLSVVCFAVLFCFILRRTGNLWWIVGFHAGWDWGQTFFYGVADSGFVPYHNLLNSSFSGPAWLTGGSVGPEASVFTPLVLLLVGILVSRGYRESRYRTESNALRPS